MTELGYSLAEVGREEECIEMVEDFIDSMEPGIDKEIFEMLYYDGMTQKEVGDAVHLERSVVSKHVTNVLKFAHLAHS